MSKLFQNVDTLPFVLTTMKMSWFLAPWFITEEQLIQQETSGVVSHISSGVPNYLALFIPHLFVQQITPVLSVWRIHKEQRPVYIRQVLCFVARPGATVMDVIMVKGERLSSVWGWFTPTAYLNY